MELVILFTLFAVVIINFILSILILSRGIKERVNIIFGFLSLSLAVWSFGILGFYFIKLSNPRIWVLLTHFSGAFLSLIFLYFSLHFPRRLTNSIPFLFIPVIPFLLVLDYLFYTNFIIGNVYEKIYEINAGYIFYSIHLIVYFFFGYVFFLIQYRRSEDVMQKKQVLYILGGSILSSALATIVDIVFPYFNIFRYIWLGPPFILILNLSITIAILKYRFLNIKVIATEFSVFIIWFLISIRFLLDSMLREKLIDGILLTFLVIFGIFLIRSILKEIKNKEEIETLNVHLQKSMNELKKIDELKTEFVSLASHQLRTPLTPIKGFSDMLLEGSVGSGVVADEDQRNAIKMINESANRMDNLIDDILDVSKLEKEGGFTYKFEVTNPEKIIKKVVDDFTKQAKDKGLELLFNSTLSQATEVKLDPSKFTDAIGNLLSNSVKYTLKGNIWVNVFQEEGNVVISIKDTGVGIEKEDMPRLFQKFYRGKEMARLDAMGTGLGLYFTRHVIEDHGGHITVQSEGPGKGSEFTVKLPKATNDLQPTTNDT